MTTIFRLLVCTFAFGVTPISFAGCGGSSMPAVPVGSSVTQLRDLSGPSYRTVYAFNLTRQESGRYPNGQLTAVKDVLYGTTGWGGRGSPFGNGTVYSLTSSGAEDVIYKFKGGTDGAEPNGGLIAIDGALYGTTSAGGTGCPRSTYAGCGTVFAVTLSGRERVIYRFKGGTDGIGPSGGLLGLGGHLYGVTSSGGTSGTCAASSGNTGCGTVFTIDTTGNERVIYRFRGGSDGAQPNAPLLPVGEKLYGTTYLGGGVGNSCNSDCGTLFAVTTDGREKVLHRFSGGSDGANPASGLIDIDGLLYGTTSAGGINKCEVGCGTVFKATTSGAQSVIYSFKGPPDASSPDGAFVIDHHLLYGTSLSGGQSCLYWDSGTIFDVSTAGDERVDYTFPCNSVWGPTPTLLQLGKALYGTTSFGKGGTVFAFTP